MIRNSFVRTTLIAAIFFAGVSQSFAQGSYPTKPVRVLIGLAPGGGTDIIARIVIPKLSEALGQPLVIENRVGAGGNIAASFVAKSLPDGYTLMFAPNGPMVISAVMYRQLPFSPTKDFVPISLAATYPLIVSVNAALPVRTIAELLAHLKANSGKNNCGGSSGFELATMLFTIKTGTNCTFVQYKGNNETAQAIMAGDLHFVLIDTGPIYPAIQGGKVRGVAVTTPARISTFPEIPSVVEAGYADLDMRFWAGLFAPAATPAPIVRKLESEMARILKQPEMIKQLQARQVEPGNMGSEEFAKFLAAEIERWDTVRKAAGIPTVD